MDEVVAHLPILSCPQRQKHASHTSTTSPIYNVVDILICNKIVEKSKVQMYHDFYAQT